LRRDPNALRFSKFAIENPVIFISALPNPFRRLKHIDKSISYGLLFEVKPGISILPGIYKYIYFNIGMPPITLISKNGEGRPLGLFL
jgi:hypothetical protein